MNCNIDVSVCCTAYNHGKYIRQCLESLVEQKGVKFEVIVHDDASTDDTAAIIREFEAKYPQIIRPVYQNENQYSKGAEKIFSKFIMPLVRGKYVAWCEGDDFWCDPFKLQKQMQLMEKNPQASFCIHLVQAVNENGEKNDIIYPVKYFEKNELSSLEFNELKAQLKFVQLTSYFVREKDYKAYYNNSPSYAGMCGDADDETLAYFFSSLGSVLCINEIMSCYRQMSINSWTYNQAKDTNKRIVHYKKMIDMLEQYDVETDRKYTVATQQAQENYRDYLLSTLSESRTFSELINAEVIRVVHKYRVKKTKYIKVLLKKFLNV